jgi:hypothetical protein
MCRGYVLQSHAAGGEGWCAGVLHADEWVSGGDDDEYEVEHVLSDGELWVGCAVDDEVL